MDHPELDDRELLRRVVSRDRLALADLYRRHGRVLFGQILFVVSDRGISEEILQDTMVAVWRDAASFRGDSGVRSWMISIARRKARDRMRRHRPIAMDDDILSNRPDGRSRRVGEISATDSTEAGRGNVMWPVLVKLTRRPPALGTGTRKTIPKGRLVGLLQTSESRRQKSILTALF